MSFNGMILVFFIGYSSLWFAHALLVRHVSFTLAALMLLLRQSARECFPRRAPPLLRHHHIVITQPTTNIGRSFLLPSSLTRGLLIESRWIVLLLGHPGLHRRTWLSIS